jgi:hypothetical protein
VFYIYLITNTQNNKHYVGFTSKSVDVRWKQHVHAANGINKKSSYLLHRAIKKYGVSNFTVETILETQDRNYALNECEPKFIQKYNSYWHNHQGYNMTLGGGSSVVLEDHPNAEAIREKLRNNSKGHIPWNKGKINLYSEEVRRKMGASNIGRKASEETKTKMSLGRQGSFNAMYGKTHSVETKAKQSQVKLGKFAGDLHPLWGTHRSEETKAKIRKKQIGKLNLATCKNYIVYHPDGNIETYRGISFFAQKYNLNKETIYTSVMKKRKLKNGMRVMIYGKSN